MKRSLLEIIAQAMCLPDSCCQLFNEDNSCCMTERANLVLAEIEKSGGPSLEEMEAIRLRKSEPVR